VALLTTAYNTQVHASTGEIPFAFVSPRRLQLIGMERMPRLRQAEERTEDASTAAEQYVEDLRALIPAVRRQLGKAQATYKRAFDARTKEKNNSVKAGDWVYLNAHSRSPKKLGFKTQGPYMVLQNRWASVSGGEPYGSPYGEQCPCHLCPRTTGAGWRVDQGPSPL